MTDIRFDGTDQTRLTFSTSLRQYIAQCRRFNRITDWRPCPVCFYIRDLTGRNRCIAIRHLQHVGLAFDTRNGHRRSVAVLIDNC